MYEQICVSAHIIMQAMLDLFSLTIDLIPFVVTDYYMYFLSFYVKHLDKLLIGRASIWTC